MTVQATPDMIPALKIIWNLCFGEDRAYTDFIFAYLLRPESILVKLDENAPAAMLCIEPFELRTPEGGAGGAYLYGVATHPERRGRGLSTKLLEDAHRILAERGYALSALVPASESLFGFYGQRGYETAFHMAKVDFVPEQLTAAALRCTALPGNLYDLRDRRDTIYSGRSMFVRWAGRYLSYIQAECRRFGGEVVRLAGRSFKGYAVCYRLPAENAVLIKELAVPGIYLADALAALHRRFAAGKYRVYLPADTPGHQKKSLPFAMVRWYDKERRNQLQGAQGKAPWIAHVLD